MLVGLASCSVNPLTGKRELTLLSEGEEVDLGRKLDEDVIKSIHLYPDEAIQKSVDQLGQKLAAASERSHLQWQFRVLDDPAVNAFAVPGGFVYVTRGLMTHLSSEAQLAAVVGHEVGHVAARHSINQLSRAAVASRGAGLLSIIDPAGVHVGAAAQQGVVDFILRHSREDEIEADDLGVRYLKQVSYDPRSMYAVLTTVEAAIAGVGMQIPQSKSTHPDPAFRRQRLEQMLGPAPDFEQDRAYLQALDGMLFGQNALLGFMAGPRWVHPIFGIQIEFPIGWKATHNRTSAMTLSQDGEALVFISPSSEETPQAAYDAFFEQTGLEAGDPWRTEIHGQAAASSWFALTGEHSKFVGIAAFVQGPMQPYEIFGLVTTDKAAEYGPPLESAMGSFSVITSPAHQNLEPMRIHIIEVQAATNLQSLAASKASSADLQTLVLLNQVHPSDPLPAGTLIKWVEGFNPENLVED